MTSRIAPAAIELLVGPAWSDDPALAELPKSTDAIAFGHLVSHWKGRRRKSNG